MLVPICRVPTLPFSTISVVGTIVPFVVQRPWTLSASPYGRMFSLAYRICLSSINQLGMLGISSARCVTHPFNQYVKSSFRRSPSRCCKILGSRTGDYRIYHALAILMLALLVILNVTIVCWWTQERFVILGFDQGSKGHWVVLFQVKWGSLRPLKS